MSQLKNTAIYLLTYFLLLLLANCQPKLANQWIQEDTDKWPTIALINEVWYQGDQQYIHPSFEYAGTGFLLDIGDKIVAATAKHVLWIAKPKEMTTVNPNPYLEKWVMHPKNSRKDSVLIEGLINTDTNEELQGPNSTIQQRDWILFSTKYVSPNIQVLKPSFRKLTVGETIYFTGCPYKNEDCIVEKGTILSSKGNRIVFSKENQAANIGGASGSPIIDTTGSVIGILSGTSVNPQNGEDALYAVSTHYLKKVINQEKDLNQPLISIYDFLTNSIEKEDFKRAINHYQQMLSSKEVYFKYSISPEELNRVASEQLAADNYDNALQILKLSLIEHPYFSMTHALIGKTYVAKKELSEAKKSLAEALRLWPENELAQEVLKGIE